MNLFKFLATPAQGMPPPPFYKGSEARAIERERSNCINALTIDETRAWLSLGEAQAEVLNGLAAMLLFAAHAESADNGASTAPYRILKGALSACAACAEAGAVIKPQEARSLSIAATKAREVIAAASQKAIVQASQHLKAAYAQA